MDYKTFEKKGKKGKKTPLEGLTDMSKPGFWWKATESKARAEAMWSAADALEKEQSQRHNLNLLHARLYGNFDIAGFGARHYTRGNANANARIAFNVVEAGVDTLAAKISKHRPAVSFLTDGARWEEQRKAKRLGQFVEGMFTHAKVYEKDDVLFVDAGVIGTGGYKLVMDDDNKVNLERAFIDDILVDEADARFGAPRQMFHGQLAHREKLIAEYPKMAKEIADAKPPSGVEQAGLGDMVQVWEGWHLRSSKTSKDGLHCIVLDGGAELLCEEWTLDRFPFVFYNFKPKLLGFWGTGVAEMLTGVQLEINRLVRSISEQLRRKGRGRIFMPLAAKVPPEHLTNAIGDIVYFNGGVPPVVDAANAVAGEEFMQLDRLYQKAFQLIGVSEMSVSAKKPSGLDAGVAIREWEDVESERFAKQHQRWDNFHTNLAEAMLDFVRVFGGPDYVSKYEHKKFMETIKWSDVAHEVGEYAIKVFPKSSLPASPAARKQTVKELQADGTIDRPTALRLLDFPDLDSEMNLGNAARDDVDAMIDHALNGDLETLEDPDRYTNLDELVERGTAAYLFAKNHEAAEDRLAALSGLIDSAAAQSIAAKQPPVPAAGAGPELAPPAPGGMPMPGGGPAGPPMTQNVNIPAAPAVPPNIA